MARLEVSFLIEPTQPYWNLGLRSAKQKWIDGYFEETGTRGLVALDGSTFLVPPDIIRSVKGRGATTPAALDSLLARFPRTFLHHPPPSSNPGT